MSGWAIVKEGCCWLRGRRDLAAGMMKVGECPGGRQACMGGGDETNDEGDKHDQDDEMIRRRARGVGANRFRPAMLGVQRGAQGRGCQAWETGE